MTVTVQEGLEASLSLHWVADRWLDLRARLRPQNGARMDGTGRGVPSSRPPMDLQVSDLMREIEEHARFLGQVLLEETADWRPRSSAMPQLLRDIAERFGHFTIARDRTALDFCDAAHEFRRRVALTLERPPAPQYMGDCPTRACEGDLYLRGATTRMQCPLCGHETDAATQREWIAVKLAERLMTASELVSALTLIGTPVPMGTIKSWIKRRRLVESEVAGLYHLADARDLAARRAERVGV